MTSGYVVQTAPRGAGPDDEWTVASSYDTAAAADADVRQLKGRRRKKGLTARVRSAAEVYDQEAEEWAFQAEAAWEARMERANR